MTQQGQDAQWCRDESARCQGLLANRAMTPGIARGFAKDVARYARIADVLEAASVPSDADESGRTPARIRHPHFHGESAVEAMADDAATVPPTPSLDDRLTLAFCWCKSVEHGERMQPLSIFSEAREKSARRAAQAIEDATMQLRVLASEPMPEDRLASEILAELRRARAKFPGRNVTMLALMEEVGELAKATFEESRERVREEAVQVATMAMRVVLDGDSTLDEWRRDKALDALTDEATPAPVPSEQEARTEAEIVRRIAQAKAKLTVQEDA